MADALRTKPVWLTRDGWGLPILNAHERRIADVVPELLKDFAATHAHADATARREALMGSRSMRVLLRHLNIINRLLDDETPDANERRALEHTSATLLAQ